MNPAKIDAALAKAKEASELRCRILEVEAFLAAVSDGETVTIRVTPKHIGVVSITTDVGYCQNSIHGQPREPMATMATIAGMAALATLKGKLEAIVIEN